MDDPSVKNKDRIQYIRDAAKYQTQFRLDATVGEGCDRHLLGLYCASREMGMDIPAIFRDKVRALVCSLYSVLVAGLNLHIAWSCTEFGS